MLKMEKTLKSSFLYLMISYICQHFMLNLYTTLFNLNQLCQQKPRYSIWNVSPSLTSAPAQEMQLTTIRMELISFYTESFWCYNIQIMNGYECDGTDIFIRWKIEWKYIYHCMNERHSLFVYITSKINFVI